MVIEQHGSHSACRVAILSGVIAAAMAMPHPASAQGFFDFLFSGFQQRPPQQENHPAPPAPGIGCVAPAPPGQESVIEGGGSTGHAVAHCVRLCDGQHFPVEQIINGTPAETCRAICPYSKTKVFVGSEIGRRCRPGRPALRRARHRLLVPQATGAQLHLQRLRRFRSDLIRCQARSDFAARGHYLDQ